MKSSYIKLRNGWFNTAGTRWNWKGDVRGAGVFDNLLEGPGDVTIEVEGKRYFINKAKALKLVEKYGSWYQAKTFRLGVIPKDELTPIEPEPVLTEDEKLKKLSMEVL